MHVSEVPEHDTLQPTQVEPESGLAVNVTLVFGANATEHPLPQETPAGLLLNTPLPVRVIVTLDVRRHHLRHHRPWQSIASG